MNFPTLTLKTARAASLDAGNRSMRAAGRTQWNAEDQDAATAKWMALLEAMDVPTGPSTLSSESPGAIR